MNRDNLSCVVYWIYGDQCVDPFVDGYVGISTIVENRLRRHKYKSRFREHITGWDILFTGTQAECKKREKQLRPRPNIGWNVAIGGTELGNAMAGVPKGSAQRAKMRNAALVRYADPAERARASAIGKAAFADIDMTGPNNSHFGKPHTEAAKELIRLRIIERGGVAGKNNPMFGRKRTEEERRRISLGVKAAGPLTPEQAKRRHENTPRGERHHAFGKPRSEETNRKNREAQLAHDWSGERNGFFGKKHSTETRRILSERARARWTAKREAVS